MVARRTVNSLRNLGSGCALAVMLASCHPSVSLGGDRGAQGGSHSSAAGAFGEAGAEPAATGGTGSTTTSVAPGTGGALPMATGGAVSGGGSAPTGGAATGGATSSVAQSGSQTTGGAVGNGGTTVVVTGGAPSTGGFSPTGGVMPTGGAATGGAATGGAPSTGGATSTTAAQAGSGGGTSTGTNCLQLTEAQCRADESCAAVLGPGARKPECAGDARGFSSCITGGCRDASTQCGKLEDLDLLCSSTCASHNWSINPDSGCPGCVCVDDVKITNAGKGWDIAPWLEADGWHYSLVPGTNRIKTCDEVKIHTDTTLGLALPNLVAVKAVLTRIAAGGTSTFVVLCDGGSADIGCQLDSMPAETVKDLTAFATALGLTLTVF
jgi:hypothetical protein